MSRDVLRATGYNNPSVWCWTIFDIFYPGLRLQYDNYHYKIYSMKYKNKEVRTLLSPPEGIIVASCIRTLTGPIPIETSINPITITITLSYSS